MKTQHQTSLGDRNKSTGPPKTKKIYAGEKNKQNVCSLCETKKGAGYGGSHNGNVRLDLSSVQCFSRSVTSFCRIRSVFAVRTDQNTTCTSRFDEKNTNLLLSPGRSLTTFWKELVEDLHGKLIIGIEMCD